MEELFKVTLIFSFLNISFIFISAMKFLQVFFMMIEQKYLCQNVLLNVKNFLLSNMGLFDNLVRVTLIWFQQYYFRKFFWDLVCFTIRSYIFLHRKQVFICILEYIHRSVPQREN